ncbi:MAG: phosphate signaling complex PhoU family protein, partial [Nocardioidaceae bacterium]
MRDLYRDQLDATIGALVSMTRAVQTATHRATKALLSADAGLAEQVILADAAIDREREAVEERTFELLALQQPVAGDLRMLVAALRMSGELERMGDLAVHIAK